MKRCRYCAEEIQDAAVLCRFCGHAQEPPKEDRDLLVRGLAALLVFVVAAVLVATAARTESAAQFKAAMHKLTAPRDTVAVAPEPAPPPPPPPPPPPAVFEVAHTLDPFRLEAGQYQAWRFELADPRPCRLTGHVAVLAGGSHDVNVYVVDEDGYANFEHGQEFSATFFDERTAAVTLGVPLESQRAYYLIVSNRFSAFTPKIVRVEDVRATCEDSQDSQEPQDAQGFQTLEPPDDVE